MASWAPPGCTIDMQDVIACASRRQNALHPPLRPMRDTSIARDQFQVNPRPPRKALPSAETRSPCAGRPELRNRRSGCSPQSAGLCSDRQPASSLVELPTGSSSGRGSDSSGTQRPPSRRSHTGPQPFPPTPALVHTPDPCRHGPRQPGRPGGGGAAGGSGAPPSEGRAGAHGCSGRADTQPAVQARQGAVAGPCGWRCGCNQCNLGWRCSLSRRLRLHPVLHSWPAHACCFHQNCSTAALLLHNRNFCGWA